MKNDLKIFEKKEFGQIRTLIKNDEIWFVGKDVCDVFGDTNYRRSLARIDGDEKTIYGINTKGGKQNVTFVSESGLYSLLFLIQPQKAKGCVTNDTPLNERIKKLRKFKRWVTHEVLPQIRKTGSYGENKKKIKSLMTLSAKRREMILGLELKTSWLENKLDIRNEELRVLKEELEYYKKREKELIKENSKKMSKDVYFCEAQEGSLRFEMFVDKLQKNGLDIDLHRFECYLRGEDYLQWSDYPSEKSLEEEVLDFETSCVIAPDGEHRQVLVPMITLKGQKFFEEELRNEFKSQLNFFEDEEQPDNEL